MTVLLDVFEDGRVVQSLEAQPDAGRLEELEVGAGPVECLPIYAQEAPHRSPNRAAAREQ